MLPQLFLYSAVVSTVLGTPLVPDVASAKILLPTKNVTSASYRSIRPPDPPGFQTRVYQPKPEPSNLLHPLGVFFSVLIYFHERGQRQGWTQPASLELYKIEPTRITISIEAFKHAEEDPSIPALTIGHVMLALYAGVAYMSDIRSFYSTKMDVSIFGKRIGVLWILGMGRYAHGETVSNTTAQSISITNSNNNNIKDDDILTTTGNDDVPDSGIYTDTLLPGISLDYQFTPRKIRSEDIFTCLMEAFLIVTHDAGNTVDFIHLDAISAAFPPRLALNIHHTNGLVPKMDLVADLLWLIAQFYATKKRFDEMDFEMIVKASGYPPSNRAAGFFMRL